MQDVKTEPHYLRSFITLQIMGPWFETCIDLGGIQAH